MVQAWCGRIKKLYRSFYRICNCDMLKNTSPHPRMLTRLFATPSLASARKPRATQRLANSAVITFVFLLVAERWITFILHGGGREMAKMCHDPTPRRDLSPRFDCAIDWVRVPKTASTSVWMAFMNPLVVSKLGEFVHRGAWRLRCNLEYELWSFVHRSEWNSI